MNLLPIYIHKGEVLYNKEGFPEKPSLDNYAEKPREYYEAFKKYTEDLKTSIDKALRFEEPDKLKKLLSPYHIYKSCCRSIDECYCVKDGAYKLPSNWRVVEQWQEMFKSSNPKGGSVWCDITNEEKQAKIETNYRSETRLIAKLVPEQVNTTASDKTDFKKFSLYDESKRSVATDHTEPIPSPVKTAEEVLEKHCPSMNNLYLDYQGRNFRDRVVKAMEEYTSQFKQN